MNTLELAQVLSNIQDLQTFEDYMAVSIGDEIDPTTFVYKNGVYIGSSDLGFSSGMFFDLESLVKEGNLNKVLYMPEEE